MVTPRLVLAVGVLAVTVTLVGQPVPSAEYRVKAAFLFNFVQFVEWPSNAFADSRAPIVLCVLGNDPFGAALDQIVEGESVESRKLIVRRSHRTEGLETCHLLYVSESEKERLGEVLRTVGSSPVLTVSDIDGFVRRGGTIGFFLDRNRVRFEIDPSHAQHRGLKVSSQLLSLGRVRESDGLGSDR